MMKHLSKHKSRRFLRANEAVSALEYAILVGVIAVAIGGALVTFGVDISTAMTAIGVDVAKITTTGGGTVNPAPTP